MVVHEFARGYAPLDTFLGIPDTCSSLQILPLAGAISLVDSEMLHAPILNQQEQHTVDTFGGVSGQPILSETWPCRDLTPIRLTARHHGVVSLHYDPHLLDDHFVALFNKPSNHRPNDHKHRCEACKVLVPACEEDWQTHTAGVFHQSQIVSVHKTGELRHITRSGHISKTEIALSHQQLKYFGCEQHSRLADLRAAAMSAVEQMAGPIAGGRVAPMWDNLATDWAIAAMKIACAAKKEDKHLTTHFKAREILCLAEILHDKQDILSITVSGRLSDDCTLHVADAVAVDKLMKALRNQTQLEAVNIQIQGPWLPSPDQGVYSGMEDAHYAEYKCASKITAQLFIPVWKSACNLFKHGQMFQLRQARLQLPHQDKGLQSRRQLVQRCIQTGHQQRSSARITACAMATHPRLGADNMLAKTPKHILKTIIQLAIPQDSPSLTVSRSKPVPFYAPPVF